jgi:hypothetical protein
MTALHKKEVPMTETYCLGGQQKIFAESCSKPYPKPLSLGHEYSSCVDLVIVDDDILRLHNHSFDERGRADKEPNGT